MFVENELNVQICDPSQGVEHFNNQYFSINMRPL